jgi:hypothetical protein
LSRGLFNLEDINVSSCTSITESSILSFIKNCYKLRKLSLLYCRNCKINEKVFEEFSGHCANLENLTIEFQIEEEEGEEENIENIKSQELKTEKIIYDLTNNLKNIKKLHLRGLKYLNGDLLSILCSKLKKLKKLTIECEETSKIYFSILKSDTLEELNISKLEEFQSVEILCKNLIKLNLSFIKNINKLRVSEEINEKLSEIKIKSSNFDSSFDLSGLISKQKKLKLLELFDCKQINNIKIENNHISELSIYMLPDLVELDVRSNKIQTIKIEVCMELLKLNIDCENLEFLQIFSLQQYQTPLLNEFYLKSDKVLNISLQRCLNLKKLNIKSKKLTTLNLSECKILELLDLECINLQKFVLSAPKINFTKEYIEEFLKNLKNLIWLSLINIEEIYDEGISKITKELKLLQALNIQNCINIKNINIYGENLKGIQIFDCPNLMKPVFDSPNLSKLFLKNLENLESASFLYESNLKNIEYLEIINCNKIKDLFLNFYEIKKLILKDMDNLEFLNMTELKKMKKFNFENLKSLKNIEINDVMDELKEINIKACKEISESGIKNILFNSTNLEELDINTMNNIDYLIIESKCLKSVKLENCENLVLPLIKNSGNLKKFSIKNCKLFILKKVKN